MPEPLSPSEQLRALLFGEPPHARHTAPEPELLAALAPLMPPRLVVRAAERLHWLGAIDELSLKRVLAPLLARLPRGEAAALVEPLFRFPGLAEDLPLPLLRAALPLVRAREWDPARRLEVLAEILPRLPDARERRELLDEALAAASALGGFQRAVVLTLLARAAPEELRRELLDRVLSEAASEGDPGSRAWVLGQVSLLAEERLRDEAAHAVRAAEIPDYSLLSLAPLLSEEQLERALEEIRYYSGGPGPANPAEALAPHLSPALLERALRIVAEAYAPPDARAKLLAALAPHLPPELAGRAAELALSLEEPWWRGFALRALGPRLPPERRDALSAEAGAYAPERIGTLARRIPPEERDRLIEEVIDRVAARYGGAAAAPPSAEAPEPPGRAAEPPPDWTPPPEERLVNTGFAESGSAGQPLDPSRPLLPSHRYLFWFEVGARLAGAIDEAPVPLPLEQLPPEARLQVAVFGFEDGLRVVPGEDVGELRLLPSGRVVVERPAATPDGDLRERRLFFPVETPESEGVARLRCNVYCEQVLVQSHLVEARVAGAPSARAEGPALRARADYTLSHSLRSRQLARLHPHRLSLLLNDNGNGTHGFRLFGADGEEEFKGEASFSGHELQNLIEKAREAMRTVAWGSPEPWKDQGYRYEGAPDRERLREDLVRLAKSGFRIFDHLIDRIAGGDVSSRTEIRRRVQRFHELMRTPGMVQIASKEQVRLVVPAAILYDHLMDTTLPASGYTLCPAFAESLDAGAPLADTACFLGECPSRKAADVVCPSGFWGFRHSLGMPVSIGGSLADAAVEIRLRGAPRVEVAVSTDPLFVRRPDHEQALRALREPTEWLLADTRDEALALMSTGAPHIVYFYCHGGVADDVPYLLVGSPGTERGITRDLIRQRDIFWEDPQPLVLINGCHTTALEPEKALDLVSGFVETANAAGVIGTEITIFEPIACAFGEEFLRRFLSGVPAGEAVRLARLKLLSGGNPLGLVYLPFVLASLALREE